MSELSRDRFRFGRRPRCRVETSVKAERGRDGRMRCGGGRDKYNGKY